MVTMLPEPSDVPMKDETISGEFESVLVFLFVFFLFRLCIHMDSASWEIRTKENKKKETAQNMNL